MTIGILAAMDRELEALTERREELAARGFVLRLCGVGKVNAALAAQDLIRQHGVDRIIVIGACASLHTHLRQGRMILANEAAYHDVDACALGFAPGQIPYHGSCLWTPDAALTHALSLALSRAGDHPWTGRVLTGDRFIASQDEAKRIAAQYHGSALDMETAAVAQTCAATGTGWAAVRIVSDNADERAAVAFETLIRTASRRLAAVIMGLRLPDGSGAAAGPCTLANGAGI